MTTETENLEQQTAEDLWVIVQVYNNSYAIPAEHVFEMVQVPSVVNIPEQTKYIRGIINLRGQVMSLIDLRVRLGVPSIQKELYELNELMDIREEDHKSWLTELEASVHEKRKFTLATDPHKCAFGQWYDHYKTSNLQLRHILKKFDEPHKAIHGIAQKVTEFASHQKYNEALQLIETTRKKELSEMINLFSEVRNYNNDNNREIAVIIKSKTEMIAISVDQVESVDALEKENLGGVSYRNDSKDPIISSIKHRVGKKGKPVLILNIDYLIRTSATKDQMKAV